MIDISCGDFDRNVTRRGTPKPRPTTMNAILSQAAYDVLEERQRQIAKGWTPDHDDGHIKQEIVFSDWGAKARLTEAQELYLLGGVAGLKLYRKRLKQAAAQIIAEIERIDRKSSFNEE